MSHNQCKGKSLRDSEKHWEVWGVTLRLREWDRRARLKSATTVSRRPPQGDPERRSQSWDLLKVALKPLESHSKEAFLKVRLSWQIGGVLLKRYCWRSRTRWTRTLLLFCKHQYVEAREKLLGQVITHREGSKNHSTNPSFRCDSCGHSQNASGHVCVMYVALCPRCAHVLFALPCPPKSTAGWH